VVYLRSKVMNIDRKLIQDCINNNRQSQHLLYKYCHPILIPIGLRYLKDRNDAIAALNKSFMKVLNALNTYEEHQNFNAWIKRIMVNTCIDEIRKKTKHQQREYPFDPSDHVYKSGSIDWNQAENKLGVEEILKLVQELPDKTRQVFNLYVVEGYQHAEVGEILDMSEGTSKWHLSKARKLLQDKLTQLLNEDNLSINAS